MNSVAPLRHAPPPPSPPGGISAWEGPNRNSSMVAEHGDKQILRQAADGRALRALETVKAKNEAFARMQQPKGVEQSEETVAENSGAMALENSVWDAALLIGLCEENGLLLSVFQSIAVVTLVIFIGFVQLLAMYIVKTALVPRIFDDNAKHALLSHRLFVDQALEFVDMSTWSTQASELCNGRVYNYAASTRGDLQTYLSKAGSFEHFDQGTILCSLAIMIWILSVAIEVRRTLEISWTILRLPRREEDVRSVSFDENEDGYVVTSASLIHKGWAFLISVARLAIAAVLLVFGSEWLANIHIASELILSVCALELLKGIDELVFEAMFTIDLRRTIENTRYSATVSLRSELKEVIWIFIWLVCVAGCFAGAYFAYLQPFRDSLKDVQKLICGNRLNFAYTMHPVSGMPSFADLNPNSAAESSHNVQCFYAAQYEMLRLRAGFVGEYTKFNPTFVSQFDGSSKLTVDAGALATTSENVSSEFQLSTSSPAFEVSLTQLQELSLLSRDDYLRQKSCSDFDVQFAVVRETCQHGKFAGSDAFWFFANYSSCAELEDVCSCAGCAGTSTYRPESCNTCGAQSFSRAHEDLYGISTPWIMRIRGLCPATCGACPVLPRATQQIGTPTPVPVPTPTPTPTPTPSTQATSPMDANDTDANSTANSSNGIAGGRRLQELDQLLWELEIERRSRWTLEVRLARVEELLASSQAALPSTLG